MRKPELRSFGSSVPSGSNGTCWQTRSLRIRDLAIRMPGLTDIRQRSMLRRMQPREELSLAEIRLGNPEFWVQPLEVREGAFQTLRRERPISFHEEVYDRVFEPGPGFWALSRHADILYAGTHPKLFCSGKSATSIADLPQEFLEFFG